MFNRFLLYCFLTFVVLGGCLFLGVLFVGTTYPGPLKAQHQPPSSVKQVTSSTQKNSCGCCAERKVGRRASVEPGREHSPAPLQSTAQVREKVE